MFGVPSVFAPILNTVNVVAPVPGTLAGRATTQPVLFVSVCWAGTGVKAGAPVPVFTSGVRPNLNELAAGHVVPAGGLLMPMMSDPVKELPVNTLTPTMKNP